MKARCSAIADRRFCLGLINFERPVRNSQFEKLSEYNVPDGDIHVRPYYYAYADRQILGASMNQLVNGNMRASLLLIMQTGASV